MVETLRFKENGGMSVDPAACQVQTAPDAGEKAPSVIPLLPTRNSSSAFKSLSIVKEVRVGKYLVASTSRLKLHAI